MLEIYQYIPVLKKRSRLASNQKSSLISASLEPKEGVINGLFALWSIFQYGQGTNFI
jgi:hypothetical protein